MVYDAVEGYTMVYDAVIGGYGCTSSLVRILVVRIIVS
jgi:hypothetical protein